MNWTGFLVVFLSAVMATSSTLAATGRILDEAEVKQADTAALSAEVDLFKTIGTGIALSLSRCAGQSDCKPNVSKDELGHLLDTINKRIDELVSRQEQKQEDYTKIITAYVNQREAYIGYQTDLERITGGMTGEEEIGKDTFGETGAPAATETAPAEAAAAKEATPAKKKAGGSEIDMDVFSDVDQPIQ